MPRVTVVKKAQQRYYTKPVIDPETGEQKRTPVMKNGEQKKTKRGQLVWMKVTEIDKDRPKPLLRCDFPGCDINGGEIAIGTSYKWIKPKSGPYGGQQRNRHAEHRSWYQWEYSSSLGARLAQISHDFGNAIMDVDSPDDVQSALDDAASEIEQLAEEKRESASNIEDDFGHETTASEELNQIADDLESWADEVRSADIPELPEHEECDDEWHDEEPDEEDEVETCPTCGSENRDERNLLDEPTEDQMSQWRDDVADAVSIVDESPV